MIYVLKQACLSVQCTQTGLLQCNMRLSRRVRVLHVLKKAYLRVTCT